MICQTNFSRGGQVDATKGKGRQGGDMTDLRRCREREVAMFGYGVTPRIQSQCDIRLGLCTHLPTPLFDSQYRYESTFTSQRGAAAAAVPALDAFQGPEFED